MPFKKGLLHYLVDFSRQFAGNKIPAKSAIFCDIAKEKLRGNPKKGGKMEVKEVVLTAAQLLGIEREVSEYVNNSFGSGREKTADLLACFNLVENELALDYLPLYVKESFAVESEKIAYDRFSKNPSRVTAVTDTQGGRIPFEIFPTELRVPTDAQTVVVEYAFLPEKKGIEDLSDYQSGVSVGLMANGVASEYCAMQGLYAEAAFWGKKYKESIAKTHKVKRGKRIQARRWV